MFIKININVELETETSAPNRMIRFSRTVSNPTTAIMTTMIISSRFRRLRSSGERVDGDLLEVVSVIVKSEKR